MSEKTIRFTVLIIPTGFTTLKIQKKHDHFGVL
jgi:hypothetical protein